MSKTYLSHLQKAQALASGVKMNIEKVRDCNISIEDVAALEELVKEGELLNGEVERLRSETSAKVAEANAKLAEIKDKMLDMKRSIKQRFDISQWESFGIADKR